MGEKKLVSIVMILLTVFAYANLFAQTKTLVTAGASWWNAQYDIVNKDGDQIYDIGSTSMFGPYLSISHDKLNFGASMFWGTVAIKDMEGVDLKRADLNFTIGYRIVNTSAFNMNLFAGIKYLNWKMTGTESVLQWDPYFLEYYWAEQDVERTNNGTMFGGGISAVIPFGTSRMYAYGSIAGLGGTLTYEDKSSLVASGTEASVSLASLNAGVGYRFPSGLGINGGYRGDFFGSEDSDLVDRLQGFNLTVSYTFQ